MNGLLEVAGALAMAGHLLAVGIAGMAPLFCIWLERRGRKGDTAADGLGRRLAWHSLAWLTVGMLLAGAGVACYWAIQGKAFFHPWMWIKRSRFEFGAAELLFFYAVMGLYAATWVRWRAWKKTQRLLAILAATDLLYHFPPLFAVIAALSGRPHLTQRRFVEWLVDGEVLARVVHHWLAASVATGVYLAWLVVRTGPKSVAQVSDTAAAADEASAPPRLLLSLARVVLLCGGLQLLSGFWLTLSLPAAARQSLLGGDLWAAGALGLGIMCGLGMLHAAGALGNRDSGARQVRLAALMLVATFVLMTVARQRLRQATPAMPAPDAWTWRKPPPACLPPVQPWQPPRV